MFHKSRRIGAFLIRSDRLHTSDADTGAGNPASWMDVSRVFQQQARVTLPPVLNIYRVLQTQARVTLPPGLVTSAPLRRLLHEAETILSSPTSVVGFASRRDRPHTERHMNEAHLHEPLARVPSIDCASDASHELSRQAAVSTRVWRWHPHAILWYTR